MIIKPYNKLAKDKLLEFVVSHPWKPTWSLEQINEFIHFFTSSHDLIFDLHVQSERIAVAILIDKIKNKGNNACLEILGLNQNYEVSQIYNYLVQSAKQNLPQTRAGIEITVEESLDEIRSLLLKDGFASYYDIYEMECKLNNAVWVQSTGMSTLLNQDLLECYQVMIEAFKDNPEMAIPNFDDWKSAKESNNTLTWVYKESNKIIGFLNLDINVEHKEGEIRTIGVLPNYRKHGIGNKLLSYGLSYLKINGLINCHLTVATQNEGALRLYYNLGFKVINHFKVYCWKSNL
ncbi:MAG: GNAT family N-acetyltransferase [Proteobacteria bacterium]|nr:GNAT family N-acetyltransferase [Pseudomonadota bacterium]